MQCVRGNPAEWEGDFRLWESLLSGALVFVDKLHAFERLPHPLVDGEHFIVYDLEDKARFMERLHYYLAHPVEARKIAKAGQRQARLYHMAANRIDFLLNSLDAKGAFKT